MLLGFGGSLTTTCMFLNNQPCTATPTDTDLNPDELHFYSFIVSLDRCDGSCNTADDPFGRICVPNKIEHINLKVFNMMKEVNVEKKFVKHNSSETRCEFDGEKYNSKQKWST